MGGFKDSPIERLWLGIILPLLIVCVVLFNLVTGRVYWLAGRSGVPPERRTFIFQFFDDACHVTGTVLLKLGIAAGLFSWYFLANNARTDRLAIPSLITSVAVAILGLAIHIACFF